MIQRLEYTTDFGTDRIELSVIGDWDRKKMNRLLALDYAQHTLFRNEVTIKRGNWHGPDFFPLSLWQQDRWKLDVFKEATNGFAARLYVFAQMLITDAGESLLWLRRYFEKLGLRWDSEQLSRLDLRTDVNCPFVEFQQRIDQGFCATGRMRPRRREDYPTTLYFGSPKHVYLRVYDKAIEQGENGQVRTRVEFQLRRGWLRRQGVDSWGDADLPALWRSLTQGFRILKRRPDGKHYDRCPTWHVWELIQQAADASCTQTTVCVQKRTITER